MLCDKHDRPGDETTDWIKCKECQQWVHKVVFHMTTVLTGRMMTTFLVCLIYVALSVSYMSIDHLRVEEWLGTKLKRFPIIRGL